MQGLGNNKKDERTNVHSRDFREFSGTKEKKRTRTPKKKKGRKGRSAKACTVLASIEKGREDNKQTKAITGQTCRPSIFSHQRKHEEDRAEKDGTLTTSTFIEACTVIAKERK